VPQPTGGLGARLAAAFAAAGGPGLLIGMDTPQVSPGALATAAVELMRDGVDAVLGPVPDGGYWAIGLRRPDPAVFLGVPMSSSETAIAQRRRLWALGLRWTELETVRDVDTFDDAVRVAETCPDSRFGALVAGLRWHAAA
jgi:uncharacterized protein